MSNRTPAAQPPSVPPEKGIELLERQIAVVQQQLADGAGKETAAFDRWVVETVNHIELAFGRGAPEVKRFEQSALWSHPSNFKSKVGLFVGTLRALLRMLATSAKAAPVRARPAAKVPGPLLLWSGHAAGAPPVADLLATLGQQVLPIDDHDDHGAKVLADVPAGAAPFAVVVLAPDDIGGVAGTARGKLRARCSQEAVFALGFLVGRLGTGRVCALLLDGLEPPSAHAGLLAIAVDPAGAWSQALATELQGAGLVGGLPTTE